MKKNYAISSMCSKYSMLKASLNNIDIGKYGKFRAFLKSESRGYKAKKAAVLQRAQIEEFLTTASDIEYLMTKVALIMGASGACRYCELTNMKFSDVQDTGVHLLVSMPDSKTGISLKFTIIKEGFSINAVEVCRKYFSLRPKNLPHDRLFLGYVDDKCTSHPVGINTFAKVPSRVASFLNLANPEPYTGHCMRRTSTTLLANQGADLTNIKQHGRWKSSSVAKSYIEESISNKLSIANKIQGENRCPLQEKTPISPVNSAKTPIDVRSQKDGNYKLFINQNDVKYEKSNNEL